MAQLRRQDEPPPPGPRMEIRRVKANQRWQFIVLGQPWGCWTHWVDDHGEPCIEPRKECPGCKRQKPLRWRCYVHVWNIIRQNDEFLELTALVRAQLDDLLPTGEPYRGQRIEVVRGRGDKARMGLVLLPPCEVRGKLPDAKDPFPTLCKLWGFPHLAQLTPNVTELSPNRGIA